MGAPSQCRHNEVDVTGVAAYEHVTADVLQRVPGDFLQRHNVVTN